MILYDISDSVTCFAVGKSAHGTEPGVDARETGIVDSFPTCSPTVSVGGRFCVPADSLMIPRQTHSVNVAWVDKAGEVPDTDAVITGVPGLCVAVKTADCIPVLLYDAKKQLVAAIHAGWRGTVGRIVERTIAEMGSNGVDLHAVIGPGICQQCFEIGDEVYDAFRDAGFPMDRIALRLEKWHIDLWEANRWLLEQCGVNKIHTDGTCTKESNDLYSARRDTIRTGRNINGIMMRQQPDLQPSTANCNLPHRERK